MYLDRLLDCLRITRDWETGRGGLLKMIVSYKPNCKVHGIRKLSHDQKGEGSHDKRVKEYLRWHGLGTTGCASFWTQAGMGEYLVRGAVTTTRSRLGQGCTAWHGHDTYGVHIS